jgi:hypothetical protein
VHGRSERWSQWLEFAPAPSTTASADGASSDVPA